MRVEGVPVSGMVEERPCPTCGRWPDEDHIVEMHDVQAKLEQETRIQLAYLQGQVSKDKQKATTAEIIDRWRDELEAGL